MWSTRRLEQATAELRAVQDGSSMLQQRNLELSQQLEWQATELMASKDTLVRALEEAHTASTAAQQGAEKNAQLHTELDDLASR